MMARAKKSFDKELMYEKIMPTNLNKGAEPENPDENNQEGKNDKILYNLTEKLVLEKLEATMKKMNCCRCDRCKEDIAALSLNNLKPMYVVASKEEINNKINESEELGVEVTTAVIKAVLTVRKNPRH